MVLDDKQLDEPERERRSDQEGERINFFIEEVRKCAQQITDKYGIVGSLRYFKIKFCELFLYISELIMRKNKYVELDKYKYSSIYNEWDDLKAQLIF